MDNPTEYTPPKVWTWNKESGGRFANINRPIAGPTHDKELPVGRHPLQLYSLATPNGVKVTVMLEELLALGHAGAEYDAWLIRIGEGDQFGSGFVAVNPELQDPGAAGPQRPEADPGVRIRRDPAVPRREVRRLPADRRRGARRMPVVAVLADGQRALSRRRLRPLLRLCADQDRIRHRPLRDGGEAPARRARPAPRREPSIWPATTTRSPTWRSGPGTARWPRACSTAPASSCRCRTTSTCSAGPTQIAQRPAVKRGRMVNRACGEPAEPAARAPRRQRLRHQDAGQADTRSHLNNPRTPPPRRYSANEFRCFADSVR